MEQIINALRNAESICIIPHINPDADAIGSSFAFKHMLEKAGKRVCVYIEENFPEYLSFLGSDYIVFDKAVKYDLCLCLDCGDMTRIATRAALLEAADVTVNIDHHYTNTNYGDLNYVDGKASSTGELCYRFFEKMGAEIDDYAAFCLYASISADTGSFKYSSTSPSTMRVAASLLEHDIDIAKINRLLFDSDKYELIQLTGAVVSEMRLECGGRVAVGVITSELMDKFGIDWHDANNIIDSVRRVSGTEAAVTFKETPDGIKVSMRTNEIVDAGKIANNFGGGGHVRAAGLTMKCSLQEAQETIIQAIKKELDEI